jgi:outer membrane immunogenic protein
MKRILFATVAIATLGLAQAANAADLPRRGAAMAPAPIYTAAPLFTWTGLYAGVNFGYGFGKFNGANGGTFGKADGGLVGATLGYNYQVGQTVFGLEGDYGYDGAKNTNIVPGRGLGAGVASASGKITDMLTARARLGYSVDRALLFVTGGYAGASVKTGIVDPTIPASFSNSSWRNGYALGGGLEYAFTQNISAKAEYVYTSFGSKTELSAPWMSTVGAHQNLVRGGVNYRF